MWGEGGGGESWNRRALPTCLPSGPTETTLRLETQAKTTYMLGTVYIYLQGSCAMYRRLTGACCLHDQGGEALLEAASTSETSVKSYQSMKMTVFRVVAVRSLVEI